MNILKKYDIEKDKLHFVYDKKESSFILYKENIRIPINRLNRKSYYKLVDENIKQIDRINMKKKGVLA